MNDQWHDFWVKNGAGYGNAVNLRPSTYDYSKAVEYIHDKIKIKPTDKLLDVGCGNGQMLEQISKFTKNISGVDYSKNMVSLTDNLMKKIGGITGTYHVTSSEDLSIFKDNSFDKLICVAVIQYFDNLNSARTTVSEMVRVCKPGGFVYMGDVLNDDIIPNGGSGIYSYDPKALGEGYNYKVYKSYFESYRRFDLVIEK